MEGPTPEFSVKAETVPQLPNDAKGLLARP